MMVAVARPSMVGAILPSSRFLARAMAEAADGAEFLVELGAGTGAITEALQERHPRTPTVAVEMEAVLAKHLHRRFPAVDVRAAPAHRVLAELHEGTERTTIVSSLPFRSLPARWRETTSHAIEHFLLAHPERRMVQYTYQPLVPFKLRAKQALQWRRVELIWRNMPPAWVWTLGPRGERQG